MAPDASAVTLDLIDPERAPALVDQLTPIYAEVYAEPPYNQTSEDTAELVGRYLRQAKQSGFRLVTAVDGSRIVGFCYTITLPAGRWWKGAQEALPDEVMAADKVAVIELVLLAAYRGQGIGHALMDAALAGRNEVYATLLAEPDAPARRIYAHWGWQQVGTVQSQPHWGADDALILEL